MLLLLPLQQLLAPRTVGGPNRRLLPPPGQRPLRFQDPTRIRFQDPKRGMWGPCPLLHTPGVPCGGGEQSGGGGGIDLQSLKGGRG